MKTIWKFKMTLEDEQTVQMPAGATVLSFGNQYEWPTLWALVDDPESPPEDRRFALIGTGQTIEHTGRFIGTATFQNGTCVMHVFELGK